MNRKNLIKFFLTYLIWGSAPLYWNLFPSFDPVFKVACRVVFSALFGIIVLAITKNLRSVPDAFRDKRKIKYIVLASVSIGANWIVYVGAITTGHVVDASLGNYLNPIALALFGMIVHKDKADGFQIASVAVAFAGVLISSISYGSIPYIGILLMITFTAYTVFKKKAAIDGVTGFTLETGIISPLAIAYMLIFGMGEGGFGSVDSFGTALLILSTGIYTSVPFMLYASGVNNFSTLFIGLGTMLTPTITLLTGILFYREKVEGAALVNMICILVAIALFITSTVLKSIRMKRAEEK